MYYHLFSFVKCVEIVSGLNKFHPVKQKNCQHDDCIACEGANCKNILRYKFLDT